MRSVKKSGHIKVDKTGISIGAKKSSDLKQVTEIIKVGGDVIKSSFDLFKEIEKTKQIAIEAQTRITESNNLLTAELARFEKDMLEIQRNFEIEFKKLDDDFKLRNRQLDLIEKLIDKIDKIEIEIKIYQEKDGLTSESVMKLFEQLHQQKLAYMNNLVLLGQN
jgi:hypothetical protein